MRDEFMETEKLSGYVEVGKASVKLSYFQRLDKLDRFGSGAGGGGLT